MTLTSRRRLLFLALLCAGCGKAIQWWEPGRLSPVPGTGTGTLRAGLARIDITPPPGVGLAGNGPEGNRASGYRMRLYARVLVLEDRRGERLALVSADLPHVSALLQRRIAQRTATVGLGVDRLLISATHTHSSFGHFYEAAAYNESNSLVAGFDREILDSVSCRIARAIQAAVRDLAPARAAWGSVAVWRQTRIRSLPAMRLNRPAPEPVAPPPAGLEPDYRLVDPTFTMLRIDRQDSATGVFRAAGAWSVFAMHGTGNTPNSELLDPDIHGLVARALERHIDSASSFAPRAVHVFANGSEGDTSPDWPEESRCRPLRLLTERRPVGPYGRRLWEFVPPSALELAKCRRAARDTIERIARRIGGAADTLFDGLASSLSDTITIERAFVTLRLSDSATAAALGICPNPLAGMSTFGGAPDARTRFYGWHWLGFIRSGMEESSASPNPGGRSCHKEKRVLLGEWVANGVVGAGLPREAQLLVARIGPRLLAGVPAEVTTTSARRMRAAMLQAASRDRPGVTDAVVVSLANGFMQYVATAEEYRAQYYEGGSTIYGPGEQAMLARMLETLTDSLSAGDSLASTPEVRVRPGARRARYALGGDEVARADSAWCAGDTLYARLALARKGGWLVRDADEADLPLVTIWQAQPGRDSTLAAVDDQPDVELHRVQRRGAAPWELRWSGVGSGEYTVHVRGADKGALAQCRGSNAPRLTLAHPTTPPASPASPRR